MARGYTYYDGPISITELFLLVASLAITVSMYILLRKKSNKIKQVIYLEKPKEEIISLEKQVSDLQWHVSLWGRVTLALIFFVVLSLVQLITGWD